MGFRFARTRWLAAGLAVGLVVPALAACGGGDDKGGSSGGSSGGTLTVWSLENQTDRVQATQKIADKFTASSGVKVKIVATDENQFASLITNAAAAGTLPDVVGALSLAGVAQMATGDLLDTDVPYEVILAGDVFYSRAMAARVLPFLRRAAGRGTLVLVGDPGRAYLPIESMIKRASYDVPVSEALESVPVRHTTVWQVRPS